MQRKEESEAKEKREFEKNLKKFHEQKGNSHIKIPYIGGILSNKAQFISRIRIRSFSFIQICLHKRWRPICNYKKTLKRYSK